jgi:hypothetical protein
LTKYEGYSLKGLRLPPTVHAQLMADTGCSENYNIQRTGNLMADVMRVHGGSDPHTHRIDLKVKPVSCSRKCLQCNGHLCSHAIMYILDCGLDPIDFVPEKYTVAGGLKFLKISLKNVPINDFSIDYGVLSGSTPPIIPPHSRIPKGRPRKKTNE